ncbi:MAG: urease accessory protein UreE [Cyanobacterium sp. T60_A2020_053]|nr:urease accessory protein UreE [Cyanobacterium sp. T60_A2020_053]
MIILNKIIDQIPTEGINLTVALTADERQKPKQKLTKENVTIKLDLARGMVIQEGDILSDEMETFLVQITAQPEKVMTIISNDKLDLMKACYHLGNRHISLEINDRYLRFSADHVLQSMLMKLGLNVIEETAPFYPVTGADHHHSSLGFAEKLQS